jgi:calcineurin-like phosphoesterase family protein
MKKTLKNKTYFTADLHFGHANIIRYENRPFKNKEEMNEVLIENWNNTIKSTDSDIFIIGDFAFATAAEIKTLLSRLRGRKHLILGNHDKVPRVDQGFVWIGDKLEIKVEDQYIFMFHYACRVWNKSHYGAWHLHGHSHGNLPINFSSKSFDIGVDAVVNRLGNSPENFRPASFYEVESWMEAHTQETVDHH